MLQLQLGSLGQKKGGVGRELIPVDGFLVAGSRMVPVNNAFLLVTEALHLFKVAMANKGLVVVMDLGVGSRDVFCVERSHSIKLQKFDHRL